MHELSRENGNPFKTGEDMIIHFLVNPKTIIKDVYLPPGHSKLSKYKLIKRTYKVFYGDRKKYHINNLDKKRYKLFLKNILREIELNQIFISDANK